MAITLLPPQVIAGAAAPHAAIVRAAARTPMSAPTPCAEWDLAALVRHLLYWSPFLTAAGRRTPPVPVAETEQQVSLDDWPDALDAARAEVVAAWSEPSAWVGTTTMGGPDQLPAPMIGGMVLGELVVHGWDLARTAGVAAEWPTELLAGVHEEVTAMAEQGRQMGIFGPPVQVLPDAPLLDQTVGMTGRTPNWTP